MLEVDLKIHKIMELHISWNIWLLKYVRFLF